MPNCGKLISGIAHYVAKSQPPGSFELMTLLVNAMTVIT